MKIKSCLMRLLGVGILFLVGIGMAMYFGASFIEIIRALPEFILTAIVVIVVCGFILLGLSLIISGGEDDNGDDQCL